MKFKLTILIVSLLFASTISYAATNNPVQLPLYSAIHFTLINETGSPIHINTRAYGVSNPGDSSFIIPAGKSDFTYKVSNPGHTAVSEVFFTGYKKSYANGYIEVSASVSAYVGIFPPAGYATASG